MRDAIDSNVILDRSGSMETIRNDVIGGFNTFLDKQKATPGEGTISLYRFDDQYETVYQGVNLKDARNMTRDDLVPRNGTALYDAIGRTINSVGARLSALPESERPDQVLVMILTDGQENASKEFIPKEQAVPASLDPNYFAFRRISQAHLVGRLPKSSVIAEMIKHQTEKYNWQFMFIGANMDAVLEGGAMGISASNSVTANANSASIGAVFQMAACKTTNYRGSKAVMDLCYNEQDRKDVDL